MSGAEGPSENNPSLVEPVMTAGAGEMADLIRSFDWSQTAIGPMEDWSPTLRVMVPFLLANRFPLLLWWGPQYVSIYNDAYRPVLGAKHPWALGKPVSECWSEIWHVLKPLIDTPFNGGPATWDEDIELEINRHGFLEETHFTIAYSPVPDEQAPTGIGGVLATVTEITEKVVGERRIVILCDLASRTGDARTTREACAIAAETLAGHAKDVPFALFYLVDADRRSARLAGAAGVERGQVISPELVSLNAEDIGEGWHLPAAATPIIVDDLPSRFPGVPSERFSELSRTAVILPIAPFNPSETMGYLVVGLNRRLELDDHYHDFLQLMKAQVSSAFANARSYEEERKRAESLAEIDRAKTVFFSNVSHEFRTPLTLMLGHIEDMLSSSDVSLGDRERLHIAYRNSLRLLKLVNTLLEFSRIEAGRVQAAFEPTDLAATTAELASVFRSATEKAGLKLIVDAPPLPELAHVDRQMWEKVVLNLVSNAFKFTLQGEIEVRVILDGDNFVLTVRDTGIGIPPDEMPRIFERFHRIEGAEGRTREGSGIGLAFVQELVRLHGGSVSADSRVGKGTIFRVSIPRGSEHLPPHQIGHTDVVSAAVAPFIEEALRWLPGGGEKSASFPEVEPGATVPDTESGGRALVLVVDDNADMRDYLRRLLAPQYHVEVVGDGEAALAVIAHRKPNLVLSDIMIPGFDGLELLKRLRADPRTTTIPVILLSARAGEESRVEGLRAGADDYLIKPFSARELLARVEAHVKMSRYRVHATETLRASEERFRAFVTASSDIVYRANPDWTEIRFLQGALPDSENPSENWLSTYIPPDDRAPVLAGIKEAVQTKAAYELEHRIIRGDGSVGWTQSRAVPILGKDGEVIEWFGASRDITDRKRAEETQQLLLSELNHRVKNMLASVHAIAQQTLFRASNPAVFADSFSGRLQSMARMHSLLTNSSWEGTDLHEIIRDQLLPGVVDDGRVIASGPALRLEPQTALHTAMMLHELGTNSVKYGALSKANGTVLISWVVNDDSLRLDWRDRGGPPIKAPLGRGFGTSLIEQTVEGEGGSARRSVEGQGLHWEIVMPLAGVDAAVPNGSSNIRRPSYQGSRASAVSERTSIRGKKFAVVEDEPLIALNIGSVLEQEGAQVSGPAATVSDALRIIAESEFDGALVDANLRGQPAGDIAAALTQKGIPFVFVTGYGRDALPPSFARAKILKKPFTDEQLLEAAAQLVEQPRAVLRLRD